MRRWNVYRCKGCPRTYVRQQEGNGLCDFCISVRESERQRMKRVLCKKIALDSPAAGSKDVSQHGDRQDR